MISEISKAGKSKFLVRFKDGDGQTFSFVVNEENFGYINRLSHKTKIKIMIEVEDEDAI
jgi:hypothetical protein